MKLALLTNYYIGITGTILLAWLTLLPAVSHAALIYQIDAQQTIGDDSASVSGFVVWDETLLMITDWHIETGPGSGVHLVHTEGAIFDASGASDSMIGGEMLQTFYTSTPYIEEHELEIIWDVSPAEASIINGWSIQETWTNVKPGVHWRTAYITVSLLLAPNAGDVVVNDVYTDDIVGWTPVTSDANGDVLTCSIVTPPANGQAVINGDCSFGEYIATSSFVGTDTFTYMANDGQLDSMPATVTINVIERPIVTSCNSYPIRQVVTEGGGQNVTVNAEMTTTFTGKITTETGLTSGARNTVRICPGTSVDYEAIATVGKVICKLNNSPIGSIGTAYPGDKLVCMNKPDGSDIDRFSIKR